MVLSSQLAVDPLDAQSLLAAFGRLGVGAGLTLAGHALGSTLPDVDRCPLPLVALIVVLALIPLALELYRGRRRSRAGEVRG
ncbi:hypothetical protein [Streptomyces sp. NPDC093260]|uniref:hypothetical protein n=1 Tax=Streptomyces sp. NPDC093260 TaxID=3155073 RepID=UPI00342B72AD